MAIADLVVILQVPNPRLPDDAYWETILLLQKVSTITSSGCTEFLQAPELQQGILHVGYSLSGKKGGV